MGAFRPPVYALFITPLSKKKRVVKHVLLIISKAPYSLLGYKNPLANLFKFPSTIH